MNHLQEASTDKTEEHRIGDAIANFFVEYKRDRVRFRNLIIRNPSAALTQLRSHFREWDARHVVSTEMTITRTRLYRFEAVLLANGINPIESIPLIALAAKNRAELISEHSDFFPVYSAFIGLSLTVTLLCMKGHSSGYLMGLATLLFAFVSATLRGRTREQVACLKELANLAEHHGKHSNKQRANAGTDAIQEDIRTPCRDQARL